LGNQSKQALLFEKRSKNFCDLRLVLSQHLPKEQKFFGSFFQKRTPCLTPAQPGEKHPRNNPNQPHA
jgi:hypothetical protein